VPDLQLSRRALVLGAIALALALALATRVLRHSGTAYVAATPAPASTVRTPVAQLVVDVVGAVRRPGLYRLAQGSRVADAVARAGGATRKADLALVNLAAPVADGTQIVVPARAPVGGGDAGSSRASPAGPVHLNTATLEDLDALPGVGPVTAQKILDYRQQHGAFSSVDELDAIPGIGPARLETLRKLVAP
jgi:competence protein ComEA